MKTIKDIKNILILGSGTLGLRIGLACALNNYKVIIYDIHAKAFESAKNSQTNLLKILVKAGTYSQQQADTALQNIQFTTDAKLAVKNADLVSESVTENLDIKKQVWLQFGALCPEKTLFTTNTSSLLPSLYAEETGRPERFCALHFHDVFYANVVDIMPNPKTETWMLALLIDFGKSIQQTPVVVQKESPAYLFNAMLIALIGAAGALVTYNVASIEDVDRSWMGNFKMPRGPFGIIDEIGLDTAWHVTNPKTDEKSQRFAKLLKTYIDQGKLGRKTGEGFYKYPNPRFMEADFI
ncbi:MAG: 3-hydroxybutyryl-CoA dehydrogenase [Flavobacteriales bacterium CG_4_8_14_3_um_filter_35_10]|nr:MAG: 3-hydroxybutyryl-CoA dehydrogenase [Flavobacteriales bacterium CG11_big_fil_rev_8_21_14_0_20_35_7]PIX06717.1 MAG: 3-hydroxybutyryl-CoA dehydrogenase [Flavobacteriales bacterium CG_4_8_14_3_um_filter_35_10]